MTLQNRLIAPIALALTGSLCLIAHAQSAQDNVFDADGASGGTSDFETPGNWSEDGPPWTNNEIDGGVSFDLEDGETYTINVAESYTSIDVINILSRSIITLSGAGQSFGFNDDASVNTGDGALEFDGIDLHLAGDMTFTYGNNDDDDPAETITRSFGTQDLAFNLIITGAISDNGEAAVNGTLTFNGGGFALLTGGIDATGIGSSFGLAVSDGASLFLAGGADYNLIDGVTIGYAGDTEGRENGHGILQVADGATLDTTDPDGGGDIDLSGWGALLVGSVTMNDEVEDLGFDENVATDAGGGDVVTDNMTLNGDSVVIVGNGGDITATTLDEGILTMSGSSTFLVQNGGEVTFNELALNNGDFINRGDATFEMDSEVAGGTFTSSGTTQFNGALTVGGTFEVLGGTTSVLKGVIFGNGSNALVSNGTLTVATDAGSLEAGFTGTMRIENGGVVTAGATTVVDADIDVIEIGNTGRIIVDGIGSTFNAIGHTTISGELFVQNGGTFTYQDDSSDSDDQVLAFGDDSIIGGGNDDDGDISTIDLLNYQGGTSGIIEIGSIYGGLINEDTGEFEAGRGTVVIQTSFDLDLRDDGTIIFALGYDADTDTGYNTLIDVDGGGQIRVNDGTSVELSVSGDEYIPTNTLWTLFNADDINGNWDDVDLSGYNTVTRTFTHGDDDGTVLVGTDYVAPLSGLGASSVARERAEFLQNQSERSQLTDLLHLFDQVPTESRYLSAINGMGPDSIASGLQIVSDTRTFSVFREALLEMRTSQVVGQPGPARRPFGSESHSLLASQDEGDAVRSAYGYGSGPDSGERRVESETMVAFAQAYTRSLDLSNKGDVIGINGNEWGIVAGVGGQLTEQTMFGVVFGYDDFSGDMNSDYGNLDVHTVRVGPFFGWSDGTWNVDGALTGALNDWSGTRRNPDLFGSPSYDWSTKGWEIDASIGVGYRIPIGGGFDLLPEASLVYSYIQTDSYTESGGPGALSVATDNLNAIIGRVGLHLQMQSIPGLVIDTRAGWQGNYSFGGDVDADFGMSGTSLPGTPDQVDRNSFYYGAQLTWLPRWDMGLTVRYEGRTGDGVDATYFGGGVSFEF